MESLKALRILALIAVLVAAAAGAAFFMRDHIAGWWLETRLAGELSRQLGAEVELDGTDYRDGVLRVERCVVRGAKLPFASLHIADARLPIGWERLREWSDEPLVIEAKAADLVWRDHPAYPSTRVTARAKESVAEKMPPVEFVVGKFSFRHEDAAQWQIADSAVHAKFAAGAWTFSAEGGRVSAGGWPQLGLERVEGGQRAAEWKITRFALANPGGGTLTGSGAAREGRWSGEFAWQDVALQGLLPAGAEAHFSGRGSGRARLADGVLTGQMQIDGAEAKKLPALVKLASIFTGEDYGTVPWQSLRFEFRREISGDLVINGLSAVSPKGLAVQGSARIQGQNVSAELRLGVQREGRPWLVAFMPVLFRKEEQGYMWTPVKVGGTLQAPTEDLTPRVVAALAAAPATQAVDTAVEIPADAVEAAGGLLRSLLGR